MLSHMLVHLKQTTHERQQIKLTRKATTPAPFVSRAISASQGGRGTSLKLALATGVNPRGQRLTCQGQSAF